MRLSSTYVVEVGVLIGVLTAVGTWHLVDQGMELVMDSWARDAASMWRLSGGVGGRGFEDVGDKR